jgi:hypothetical protein
VIFPGGMSGPQADMRPPESARERHAVGAYESLAALIASHLSWEAVDDRGGRVLFPGAARRDRT